MQRGEIVLQIAVVGKHPVAAPEFACEGVGVFQRHFADGGLAHMGDDVLALERVFLQKLRHRRPGRTLVVHKQPQAATFKESYAPAVGVFTGVAAALAETGEAERGVGGGGAVESEQLAHLE
ncbi:hypothetical protein D9M69_578970 [compost metagenome]